MIYITKKDNELTIEGHSRYAEKGKDIICCAVSVLSESFVRYIKSLNKHIDYEFDEGYSKIIISDDEESKKLFETLIGLLKEIEEQYPDYIKGETI